MLYITGDTHGDVDMSNLSSRTLKRCCAEQNVDFHTITAAIVLGDFGRMARSARIVVATGRMDGS